MLENEIKESETPFRFIEIGSTFKLNRLNCILIEKRKDRSQEMDHCMIHAARSNMLRDDPKAGSEKAPLESHSKIHAVSIHE
jgi:UDP-N-acetylenolpyruvoylglucosamine reductase